MKIEVIRRNKMNSVTEEDYIFWSQMEEFKGRGWDGLIIIALFFNDYWLDDYEEG